MIDKSGKVLAAEPGSPAGTVEVVEKFVGKGDSTAPALVPEPLATEEPKPGVAANAINGTNGTTKEDVDKAEVAAQVADTAEKLDSNDAKPVSA